ncbi:ATP-binding sensor histidine kinase [Microcoleus sp. B4-D4]|uniref:ATP-binding sensor histidine kinase n=1 Tax=Microcoleus sp. B4-D4 TaxID=2818667 RepID=UPI002FD32252
MNNSHKNSNSPTSIQIPNYQITQTVYAGSRTIVYRAVRTDDQLPVIIKLMKRQYPTFSELVQFRNQYSIAKNLDIPGLVKPYSLEPYHNGYALVMEDFGGISLEQFTQKKTLTIEGFLPIALSLTDILHSIHQQRVIHKDIKPANILIHPDTKQVKLIDFSISTLLPRETQQIQSINALEGTLAYLSPEQTGRMNRGIDYRSDYYSLGITWFELLTGKLPFLSDDPMELVHCHIAKQPPNLRTRGKGKDIPQVLCDIVMKLIAKNAEDRYHSTLGLKHDLEQCLFQLNETAKIEYFQIGQRDLSDRFLIPDKLFGREAEIETLIQAFGRVVNGSSELMLVTGFSGIGKTAIVNEVHKPIVRSKGYFIKGKYDQFQRNIPFSGLVQTFRDLMGQLLSESDSQLEQWKAKILSALGENGQVLIDVIPELEEIIGKQPSAIELAGSAAQNRFNLLIVKFIEVFATLEHPLVMFLDDLQWADSASLSLMKLLMSQAEGGYLLIIGAYRDNEVFLAHPLMLALEEIQKTKATVNTIALTALSQSDVNLMIADTLSCAIERAMLLTELVYQKAKGNPFFTTQFLKALYEDGLIAFDWNTGSWQCDVAQVRSLALTDDVVEFMAVQLQKLPPNTQDILKLAACIGNQFDLGTLAIVYEKSQIETASDLWKALQEGFVIPINEVYKFYQAEESATVQILSKKVDTCSYKFLHDRVQQAAYSLIPNERKQATHLQIGQLLLRNTVLAEREEILFEIANQLNRGRYLLNDPEEQERLSQLNLLAGRKAKNSTAYTVACEYITTGMELLREDCWNIQYELCFALHKERVEVEYLNGNIEASQIWIDRTLERTRTALEKAEIYNLAIIQYTLRAEYPEAIAAGIKALSLFGIDITDEDFEVVRDREIATAQAILESRGIASLSDLPMMTDPEKKMATKLAIAMGPPTYRSHQRLWSVICAKAVNLCLQYGNTPEIGYIYPAYGGLRGYALNNYQNTGELIDLTLQLMPKFNNSSAESVAYLMIGSSLRHWSHPLKVASQDYQNSYQIGWESSNLQYAAYAFGHNMYCRFYQGVELKQLEAEINQSLAFSQQQKNQWSIDILTGGQMLVAKLRGTKIWSETIEDEYLERCRKHKNWQVICIYTILKSQILYLCDCPESALESAEKAESEIVNVAPQGLLPYARHRFIYALLLCQSYDRIPQTKQSDLWQKLIEYKQQLAVWAQNCSENFSAASELISAEMARISGDKLSALELYDRAIYLAKEHLFLNEEALGNELAAKFYLDWGKEKIAQAYMTEAYYCYARWGAKAKVTDLEKRYPQLLAPILQQPHASVSFQETISLGTIASTKTSSSVSEVLDLATLLKVSQAISGEIELDQLLTTLLQIVMTNAGASKCVLLLKQDIELQVAAFVEEGQEPQLLPPMPLESSQNVAIALVNTVKRSLKPLVLVDARLYPEFSGDRYIEKHQPKSVLCSPILNQGKLIGILYLENNLTVGAFTSDRVELLNLLCSQAAISLENARLYQQSQQALTELRASEARFHKMADNIPGMVFQLQLAADGAKSITYASSGCINLYEAEPEMVMAGIINVFDAVYAGDLADLEQAITKSAQTLTPFNHEWRSVTSSGTIKWVQAISQPERRADESTVWDGVVFDVSDRKRSEAEYKAAETALQISEHNLRTIFNNVSSAIIIHDLDGKVLDVNNRVLEMFGVEREKALQCSILDDYSTPDNPFHLVEDWWKRVLAGETIEFEWNVRKIDSGTAFEVYVTLNRIILDGKAVILGNLLDISDRKRAEAAIIQKSQELEQALQNLQQTQLQMIQSEKMSALGNLVAGVAHEINNPVGFLTGNITPALDYINDLFGLIDLVQQKYPQLDPEIQEELENIELDYIREDLPKLIESMQEGVKRIQDISISLRTFSRADSDRPVACNIHEGIDSTIMILKHRLKANDTRPKIQVIKHYGDLPKIECYAGQLNQVFMNILGNAIDALDELNIGRSYAEIKANPNQIIVNTELSGDRKQVVIRIKDNGIGMNESVLEKVFDNLFTTKSVGKGTGLGLAIAQQIVVEKHHGQIKVDSVHSEGTVFSITIPVI